MLIENSNNIYTIFSGLQDALVMENIVQNSTASYNPKLYQYDLQPFSTASDNLKWKKMDTESLLYYSNQIYNSLS